MAQAPAQAPTDELARFRLDGRVAVVSGGTGAIGSRLALGLAGVGAKVALLGRSAQDARTWRSRSRTSGRRPCSSNADVTRKADADRAIDETVAKFGRVDIIVNAVGGGAGTCPLSGRGIPRERVRPDHRPQLPIDLLPTQAAVRQMIKGGRGGRVLHISSVRGQLGVNMGYLAYVAAKGAINVDHAPAGDRMGQVRHQRQRHRADVRLHAAGRRPPRRRKVQVQPARPHPAQPHRARRTTWSARRCSSARTRPASAPARS